VDKKEGKMEGIRYIKINGQNVGSELLPTVYTVSEVAEILKVSEKTVYKEVKEGNLKSVKVRGSIRVSNKFLEEYLKIFKGGQV